MERKQQQLHIQELRKVHIIHMTTPLASIHTKDTGTTFFTVSANVSCFIL